jgi:hypothetical protein
MVMLGMHAAHMHVMIVLPQDMRIQYSNISRGLVCERMYMCVLKRKAFEQEQGASVHGQPRCLTHAITGEPSSTGCMQHMYVIVLVSPSRHVNLRIFHVPWLRMLMTNLHVLVIRKKQ